MSGLDFSAPQYVGTPAFESFSTTESVAQQAATIQSTSLNDLPKELILDILSMLPIPCSVSLVCRAFKDLSIEATKKRNTEKYGELVRNLSLLCQVPVDARCISVRRECPECLKKNSWPQEIQPLSEKLHDVAAQLPWIVSGKAETNGECLSFGRKILSLPPVKLMKFLSLDFVRVMDISDFTTIPSGIGNFSCIETLLIEDCLMTSLPETMEGMKIRSLLLCKCPNLESIAPAMIEKTGVRHLTIAGCPKLSLEDVEWPDGMSVLIKDPGDLSLAAYLQVITKTRRYVD